MSESRISVVVVPVAESNDFQVRPLSSGQIYANSSAFSELTEAMAGPRGNELAILRAAYITDLRRMLLSFAETAGALANPESTSNPTIRNMPKVDERMIAALFTIPSFEAALISARVALKARSMILMPDNA